jgi:hypothetical protein
MKTKTQKPLATITRPVKAELYRSKFHPFEALKYLDVKALKKAKQARIEIGSIEAAGVTVTVAAEIKDGSIIEIRPVGCVCCEGRKAEKKHSKATVKKVALKALKRSEALGEPTMKLPIPVERLGSGEVMDIEIGPIIIILDDDGFDICILVDMAADTTADEANSGWCLFCLFGGSVCGGPVVLN